MGPRAKCDQIIYEAIAKATEIIVRGRCQVPPIISSSGGGKAANSTASSCAGGSGSTGSGGSGSSSVKFKLEVEKVDSVRSILQMWKKALDTPLRLDVYYQYCTDASQPEQTTRKELLERWCIDYLPSEQPHRYQQQQQSMSSSTAHSNATSNNLSTIADETIAQLHQVCKHLVILLRTIYSFTRIMPSYRLHRALLLALEEAEEETVSMAVGGGYYQQQQHQQQQHQQQHPPNHDQELLGGKILYSFYVSDKTPPHPQSTNSTSHTRNKRNVPDLTQDIAPLISSSSNGPFARHDFQSVPTPFGFLHLTALYDSSLDVDGLLTQRADRLGVDFRSNTFSGGSRCNAPGHTDVVNGTDVVGDCRSRSIPNQNHQTPVLGNRMNGAGMQQHQEVSQLDRILTDSSKNPIRTNSNNAIATEQEPMARNTINSDNTNAGSAGPERVLSGLSLALMNQPQPQKQPQQQSQQQSDVQSSPGTTNSKSGDGAASSLRQRLAFHHPPPSFGNAAATTPSSSFGNSNNNTNNATADQLAASSSSPRYHPFVGSLPSVGCRSNSPGQHPYSPVSLGNSPPPLFIGSLPRRGSGGPILVGSTPPQPAFIGSLPKRGTSGGTAASSVRFSPTDSNSLSKASGVNRGISSPPFRNPVSLLSHPVQGSNIGSLVEDKQNSMAGTRNEKNSIFQPPYGTNAANGISGQGIEDKDVLLPPLTSLDMLANNPFKELIGAGSGAGGNFTGSLVSSLSLGMGSTAYFGPNDDSTSIGGFASLQSRPFLPATGDISGVGGDHPYHSSKHEVQEMYSYDDMPFAVDIDCTTALGDPEGCNGSGGDLGMGSSAPGSRILKKNSLVESAMGSSAGISSSQVVTSLAHRCATAGRLKLFRNEEGASKLSASKDVVAGIVKKSNGSKNLTDISCTTTGHNGEGTLTPTIGMPLDESAMLASQLAEFHSFEDSLLASGIMRSGGGGRDSSTIGQGSVCVRPI